MELAIITVQRPGTTYLYQSLLSLLGVADFRGLIHLFVGSADSSYLDGLAAGRRLVVHQMSAAEGRAIADWSLPRRHSYNYWRVLDHFARRNQPVCISEDDVLYDPWFEAKLVEAIAELEGRTDDYILSYYQGTDLAHDLRDDPRAWHGRLIVTYPGPCFFGTQGVYCSRAALPAVRELIYRRGVLRPGEPTDILFHDLDNIYLVRKSLVQHLGRESTGLGYFHTSPTFGRPWPGRAGRAYEPRGIRG